MERATLIIPCFNEARRLDTNALASLLDDDGVDVLFVDDGSTDGTREILETFSATHRGRVRVLGLDQNAGKAEAVRRGLAAAVEPRKTELVGYLDADLATPPAEMHRLIGIIRGTETQVLMGARVALLGHEIERSAARHYLGRVFATLASMSLRMRIYDTQCGAKLFRVSDTLAEAVREPFISRWAFDVELLGRLLIGSIATPPIAATHVWEEPLCSWCDVKGSKLSPRQMGKALFDLARIERDLSHRRAAMGGLEAPVGSRTKAVADRESTRAAR